MLPIVGFMKNFLLDMNAPKAPIRSKVLEIHGDQRIDPYFWLNDRNDPEVIAYLDAENEYREQVMASLKPLEDKLFKEIVGRIKQTDMSVPYKQNGYWYLTQLTEGHEYPVYLRRKDDLNAVDEILLDVNRLANRMPTIMFKVFQSVKIMNGWRMEKTQLAEGFILSDLGI
jgi:oligopeptidase B